MNREQALTALDMQSKGYIFTTTDENELGNRAIITFNDNAHFDDFEDPEPFEDYLIDGDKVITIILSDDEDMEYSPKTLELTGIQCWAPQKMNW